MAEFNLIDNGDKKRFEFEMEGERPRVEYIKAKEKIFLTHTEVPKHLGGQGIGSQLAHSVLSEVERLGLELVPLCPFIASYIKKNPEWKKLVLKGINIE